jgi:hypothetical protein
MEFIVWSCSLLRCGATLALNAEGMPRWLIDGAGGASLGVAGLNSDVLSPRTLAVAAKDPSGATLCEEKQVTGENVISTSPEKDTLIYIF